MAENGGASLAVLDGELAELDMRRDAILQIKEGIAKYERATGIHLGVIVAPVPNGDRAAAPSEPTPETRSEPPRGRVAVREIVRERPGMWALKDLIAEFDRRGWLVSPKAVEVAVHRLVNNGEARRLRLGVYEFPATTSTEGVQPC